MTSVWPAKDDRVRQGEHVGGGLEGTHKLPRGRTANDGGGDGGDEAGKATVAAPVAAPIGRRP